MNRGASRETTDGNHEDTQGPTVRNFKLNHPKNFIAVPLALTCAANTDFLIREYAVNLPRRAVRGARETGLIYPADDAPEEHLQGGVFNSEKYRVSEIGEAILVTAQETHGGCREALEAFQELHRSPKRFVDVFPEWRGIAQRIAFQYPITNALVAFLREQGSMQLYELTWLLWRENPALVHHVFLQEHAFGADVQTDRPTSAALRDASVYRSEVTFQYKAFLYHCGIIDRRGTYSSELDPQTDTWALDPAFNS